MRSQWALLPATLAAMAISATTASAQQSPDGLARPGTAKVLDRFTLPNPGLVKLGGLLGDRFEKNERVRLLNVDEEELLAGFRHKPGKQAWIGEHVGKWLHAASLAYAATGDPALRAKLDRVARELLKTQEPDGYLGTYVPEKRFGLYPDADWDVWVHKYDLLGLLAYYQYTHNAAALEGAKRVGDLLIRTFGPGKKSIISAGTHIGMAATSVLEPVVLLYRATADARYLDFAKYIVSAWEEPNGPHILSSLEKYRSVRRVANGKAYEMLSNLNGLCELYRATGEKRYLDDALIAWNDVSKNRLYITGSGSAGEHWQDDYHLPNGEGASICETCVTVTWEQFNIQLLRLTGDAKFADQLEKSVYNHLLGAQKPTGEAWAYYTPLQGHKPYGSSTNCCLSSGPRGVALLPDFAYATTPDGIAVNLFTNSTATLQVGGQAVKITQTTNYPLAWSTTLTVTASGTPRESTLRLRMPEGAYGHAVEVYGKQGPSRITRSAGYLEVRRVWRSGDRVEYQIPFLAPHEVLGDHENAGRAAVTYGPLVLAADLGHNPGAASVQRIALAQDDPKRFTVTLTTPASNLSSPVFETSGSVAGGGAAKLKLVPFYAAGADGSPVAVWLRRPGAPAGSSLFFLAQASQSREGNQPGEIMDDDVGTFRVTFNAQKADEDWYAVSLPKPVEVNRIVFAHGHCFHDGGWFDTSVGKPRIQVRRTPGGAWEDAGVLEGYPATTASSPGRGVRDGRTFELKLAPTMVCAIRVIGKPASGDNSAQAFSSCAELQAFRDR